MNGIALWKSKPTTRSFSILRTQPNHRELYSGRPLSNATVAAGMIREDLSTAATWSLARKRRSIGHRPKSVTVSGDDSSATAIARGLRTAGSMIHSRIPPNAPCSTAASKQFSWTETQFLVRDRSLTVLTRSPFGGTHRAACCRARLRPKREQHSLKRSAETRLLILRRRQNAKSRGTWRPSRFPRRNRCD